MTIKTRNPHDDDGIASSSTLIPCQAALRFLRNRLGVAPRCTRKRSANALFTLFRDPSSGSSQIGGEGEIRTHEPRKGPPVFKTGAFNRSATSPNSCTRASGRDLTRHKFIMPVCPKARAWTSMQCGLDCGFASTVCKLTELRKPSAQQRGAPSIQNGSVASIGRDLGIEPSTVTPISLTTGLNRRLPQEGAKIPL